MKGKSFFSVALWVMATVVAFGFEFDPAAVVHHKNVSRSQWLWTADAPIANGAKACFRRVFMLTELPRSATIAIRYDDVGRLFVNGKEMPAGDILSALRVGRNVFAVEGLNGMGVAGVIFLARLIQRDGSVAWIHSDEETKAVSSGANGWTSPDFDDQTWPTARLQGDVLANPWIRHYDATVMFATPEERARMVAEIEVASRLPPEIAKEPPVCAKVVYEGNIPKIDVNGTRIDPIVNLSEAANPWTASAAIREARVGVRIFQVKLMSHEYWQRGGKLDFAQVDARVRRILHLVPDGYLMLAIDLDLKDWAKEHPEAQLVYGTGPADPAQDDDRLGRPVRADPSSPRFRAEARRVISDFGAYVQNQPWGNRVIAVRVNYGVYTEWHAYGMYEKPKTSPEALADLLLVFASDMKRALPGRLVGAYYGYVFCAHPPVASNVFLERVLDSPDVDFLSNPPSYNAYARLAGAPYAPRTVTSAFRLRNKLSILEDDSRFDHVREYADSNGEFATRTPEETEACMRRNLCNMLFDGEGIQLADPIRGIGTRPDVFDSPPVFRAFTDTRRVKESAGFLSADSGNDTVIVVDPSERLVDWQSRPDAQDFYRRWSDGLLHLHRTGASFDVMLKSDFKRMGVRGRYRVIVDFNAMPAFKSGEEARRFLAEKGSWLYADAGSYFRRHGDLVLLHVGKPGRYAIRFPEGERSGRELYSGVSVAGEQLAFETEGPATWLIRLDPLSGEAGKRDVCERRLVAPVRIVTTGGKGRAYGRMVGKGAEVLLEPRFNQFPEGQMWEGSGYWLERDGDDEPYVVLDFGRELCGGVRIGIGSEANDGVLAHVRFGESVAEAVAAIGDRHAENVHSTRDMTVWASRCGYMDVGSTGFRFVYIGLASKGILPIEFVKAVSSRRPMRQVGSFRCSDERLNRIFDTAVETAHLCCQNYLWDGIKRDRCVWMGDMHPELVTIINIFGRADVIPESLDYIIRTTPSDQWMNGTIGAYTLWWMKCMHDWWYYTGDISFAMGCRDYYRAVCTKMAGLVSGVNDFTLGREFLDWPSQLNRTATHNGVKALMMMAFRDGAELADAMGETDLAKLLRTKAGDLIGFPGDPADSKSAAAIMAVSGFCSAKTMFDEVIGRNGTKGMSTFYGYYMLEAMSLAGQDRFAMDMVRDYWGGMLDVGATSFWEDFDLSWTNNCFRIDELPVAGKKDVHGDCGEFCYPGFRRSLCHGWSCGPAAWLIRHVLGIRPMSPGCRDVEIRPYLGNLDWAEGAFALPTGERVFVRVEKKDSQDAVISVKAPSWVRTTR